MNKTIKNKLLHFYTDGSIYEDFAESRAKKTAKFRRIIRACFYAHCAAAVICIVAAAVMHAGLGTVAVAVCEVILATMAFLAVGDMTLMKTLLYCGDIVFAAAMFVTGAMSENKTPFYIAGAVSVVVALIALAAFFAALCKMFLEGFSPLAIRREHYTLLPNFSYDVPDDIPDMPDTFEKGDDSKIVLPPPRSEFQELADKVKEIFHAPKKDGSSDKSHADASPKQTAVSSSVASGTQSKTEVM